MYFISVSSIAYKMRRGRFRKNGPIWPLSRRSDVLSSYLRPDILIGIPLMINEQINAIYYTVIGLQQVPGAFFKLNLSSTIALSFILPKQTLRQHVT